MPTTRVFVLVSSFCNAVPVRMNLLSQGPHAALHAHGVTEL